MATKCPAAGNDFMGGEFVVTEQRPRQQLRVEVVPLKRGDTVIFPVRLPARAGARGYYRATMSDGVSRLHAGSRTTLGVTCHNSMQNRLRLVVAACCDRQGRLVAPEGLCDLADEALWHRSDASDARPGC
jgi:hypothetical protein